MGADGQLCPIGSRLSRGNGSRVANRVCAGSLAAHKLAVHCWFDLGYYRRVRGVDTHRDERQLLKAALSC